MREKVQKILESVGKFCYFFLFGEKYEDCEEKNSKICYFPKKSR